MKTMRNYEGWKIDFCSSDGSVNVSIDACVDRGANSQVNH